MLTDPLFLAAAVAGVFILGMSKGGFGAVGQISLPLVALTMPVLEAAALLLPIMIVQDALAVWFYRRDWDSRNLIIMLPGAVLGIVVAWMLAAHVSDAFVRLGIGVVSVAFVLNTWFGRAPVAGRSPPSVPTGVFWAAMSGFTSTLAQAGGPPFQVYVLPQGLAKLTFVGTSTIFFAVTNVIKIAPYLALGQFSTQNFTVSLTLIPLAIATNFLGFWLVRITPTVLFYRIAHVLLFLISLELIREGVLGLMRP